MIGIQRFLGTNFRQLSSVCRIFVLMDGGYSK